MQAYEQAMAIEPDIFEPHNGGGVMVQERSIEERAGYYYVLAKTCAKHGIAFWDYLGDRLRISGHPIIPVLPELVRCRGQPA